MEGLTAELGQERGRKRDLQERFERSEASLRTDSRRSRENFEAIVRKNRELEVEVSNPAMVVVK